MFDGYGITNGNLGDIEFKNSLLWGNSNIGYTYMCTCILSNVNDGHSNKTFV